MNKSPTVFILMIISLFFVSCSTQVNNQGQTNDNNKYRDSVYITVDSSSFNKNENAFDKVLVYRINDQIYEIYRKTIRDYASEFNYNYNYSDTANSFVFFSLENLPVGNSMDVIFNNKDQVFYRSDWNNAMLLNGSIDFAKGKAKGLILEPPNCGEVVDISLKRFWEPTEEYKNRTLIKK